MSLAKYSDEQRERALEIAEVDGARAAARAIGCSHTSVLRWWADAEAERSTQDKNTRQVEARNRLDFVMARNRLRYAEAANELLERALEADHALDTQRLMVSSGIAFDKAGGVASAEAETVRLRGAHGYYETEMSTAEEARLDRELARMVEEFERAIIFSYEQGLPNPQQTVKDRLDAAGEIVRDGMPSRETVRRWINESDE